MTRPSDAEILKQLKAYHAAIDHTSALLIGLTHSPFNRPKPEPFLPSKSLWWQTVVSGAAMIQQLEGKDDGQENE